MCPKEYFDPLCTYRRRDQYKRKKILFIFILTTFFFFAKLWIVLFHLGSPLKGLFSFHRRKMTDSTSFSEEILLKLQLAAELLT